MKITKTKALDLLRLAQRAQDQVTTWHQSVALAGSPEVQS